MSTWESCVRHLRKVCVVPPSCNINNVVDLIKNGSALCRLLNVLQPLSIDSRMISMNPKNSKFLSFKNISAFLETCESKFDVPRESLFQVNDLLNEEDLDKVLVTLSRLFSTNEVQKKLGLSQGLRRESIPFEVCQHEDETIYQRAIDILPKDVLTERKSVKQLCIEELISTEKKYIYILGGLIEKYKFQLSGVLSPSDSNLMFSSIQKLYEVHTSFHNKLLGTLHVDSDTTIAECFISSKEQFLVYGLYCSGLTTIQNLIDEKMQRPEFVAAINEGMKSWPEVDLKFRDLFIIPMQRILKYPLFMKTCLSHIPENNQVERKIFSKALDEMEDLALYINETKRDFENIININKIENSIKGIESNLSSGMHLIDYGRLLKDGEMKCKSLNKSCVLFLLDKLLLLCLRAKENGLLELNKYFVVSQFNIESRQKSEKCFALLSDCHITEFKAKSKEERDDWVKHIRMAMEINTPSFEWNLDSPRPQMIIHTYKEITICDVCRKLLKGLFFQGYHCTSPKLNVHKDCLPKLQYSDHSILSGLPPTSLASELWYAGNIDRAMAESILRYKPDGTYLVRKKGCSYVICLKYIKVNHIQVRTDQGQFRLGDDKCFAKIQDLVQFYKENTLKNIYNVLPTKLVLPHKSFTNQRFNYKNEER